jgi:hypothetical protein
MNNANIEIIKFIKVICQEHDTDKGCYPENEWKGMEIFKRILVKLEEIKTCPHCDKKMDVNIKMSNNDYFSPENIQYVFICYGCNHEEVI